jgi:hypothetical protein
LTQANATTTTTKIVAAAFDGALPEIDHADHEDVAAA